MECEGLYVRRGVTTILTLTHTTVQRKKCYPAAVITKIETSKNEIIKQKFCQNMATDILEQSNEHKQSESYCIQKKETLNTDDLGTLVTQREECHLLSQ